MSFLLIPFALKSQVIKALLRFVIDSGARALALLWRARHRLIIKWMIIRHLQLTLLLGLHTRESTDIVTSIS